jgi:hypothetical protein
MAWNLWRASLAGPLTLGFDPEVSRAALFGGRQEVREPRIYQNMVATDIRRAYPTAMASNPYGLSLRSVSPTSTLDPTVAGLAHASVFVENDMPFAPLPIRLAPDIIQFQRGPIRGTWAWCELAAARDLGCEVTVHDAWAPRATVDLFGTWWQMVRGIDQLPPGAQNLAKGICNSLWGQFAMTGDQRATIRWVDDRGTQPFEIPEDPRNMPHAWTTHIAAETTARVRTRLLAEGLYNAGIGHPVHVDTDGVIVRATKEDPTDTGNAPGQWRRKAAMRRVDIRAPQLYRWTCGKGCGVSHAKWHYVAAGVDAAAAPAVFDAGMAPTAISYRSLQDTCVPTTHSGDREDIARLIREAKALAGVGYG